MKRLEFYLSVSALIFLIIAGFNLLHSEFKEVLEAAERLDMYNKSIDWNGANGVYFRGQYYCVWTEGRQEKEITRTETHEKCHELVYQDSDHFCKRYCK